MKHLRTFCLCIIVYVSIILILLACSSGVLDSPPESMIQGAEFVGIKTCTMCHSEMVRDFKMTNHGHLFLTDSEGLQGCESCHGAGSQHVNAGGGRGVHIINPERNPKPCFRCHLSVKAEFHFRYHHPLRESRIACTDCHDPHGEDIYRPRKAFADGINATCRRCHREQARPRVFEHEALREGCTVCHNPHGSISSKLLDERDTNLCLKCHGQIASPGLVVLGSFNHTNFLTRGTCWSMGCHTAAHGSDVNAHFRY
ncbi:MAG: hypothetical protein M0P57_08315 [Syntrophales bacterium]|nr:hypothetical protein [Syntrophales bacterium]MDY0043729.1 cytochrome c3 family protein [Syntrophales bacterium]